MFFFGLILFMVGLLVGVAFSADFPLLGNLLSGWLASLIVGISSGLFVAAWTTFIVWRLDAFQYLIGKSVSRLGPMNASAIFLPLMDKDQSAPLIKELWSAVDEINNSSIHLKQLHFNKESNLLGEIGLKLQHALESKDLHSISSAVHEGTSDIYNIRAPIIRIATTIAIKWIMECFRFAK